MKKNARSSPALAAALLLAASAAAVSGCDKAPSSSPARDTPPKTMKGACTGPATAVTVFVEWNGSVATTRNKTVYVCEGKDWVEWVSCEGEISEQISWKDGSPFDEPPRHEKDKKVLKSRPAKKGLAGKGFDYEIEFVPPGGSKPVRIDPRIEILP